LVDPAVGVVTCIYRGRASSSVWSRLGALFIDDWFAPSVWVAHLFGSRAFAFGATIALRRETLAAAGGFGGIADQVADDFWLGELTRSSGLRTVLSTYQVSTDVVEANLRSLFEHELRWLRVIRSIQPLGFALCFITFGFPVALAGFLVASGAPAAKLGLWTALAARLALHFLQRARGGGSVFSEAWLVIPRDFLNLAVWCVSFSSRRVRWGGQRFLVGPEGVIHEIG
jgi:ceramide glucosyltransferase